MSITQMGDALRPVFLAAGFPEVLADECCRVCGDMGTRLGWRPPAVLASELCELWKQKPEVEYPFRCVLAIHWSSKRFVWRVEKVTRQRKREDERKRAKALRSSVKHPNPNRG